MKKIDNEVIKFLSDAVHTADSVNIPNIVIDEDGLRGLDPNDKLVVILKPVIDIDLPFESLALGDVSRFLQRLNIHNSNNGSEILIDKNDNGGVKSLKFKSKNLSIDYRCVKSSLFNKIIPKRVNDQSIGVIELNDDVIDMLKKGFATMKCETVLFYKPKDTDEIQFIMKDDTKSEFTYDIELPFKQDDPSDEITFANNYPIKTIMAALKDSDTMEIVIGENGSLTIKKNRIDIIIPRRLV